MKDKKQKITDLFIDSFIADAIGFSFEGMLSEEIKEELLINEEVSNYDPELLVRPHNSGLYEVGTYSDDSQMTLNTIKHFLDSKDFLSAAEDINGLAKALAFMVDNDDHANYISPGLACLQAFRSVNNGIVPPETMCPKGRAGCGSLVRISPLVLSGAYSKNVDLFQAVEASVQIIHRDDRVLDSCKAFAFILKTGLETCPEDTETRLSIIEKAATLENVYITEEIPELLKRVRELSEMELSVLYQEITNIGLVDDGGIHCTYYVIPVLIASLVFWLRQAQAQACNSTDKPDTTLQDIVALSRACDSVAFLCAQLCAASSNAASSNSRSTFIPEKVREELGSMDEEVINLVSVFSEKCV